MNIPKHFCFIKNCLFWYIKYMTDNNTYLDILIVTKNTQCIEHEVTRNTDFCTRNIREWCEYCSDISYFNQIVGKILGDWFSDVLIESVKDCKLCGKLIY